MTNNPTYKLETKDVTILPKFLLRWRTIAEGLNLEGINA